MYIEDLIASLSMTRYGTFYERTMIHSLSDQINNGQALTQKQATMALRILSRYTLQISEYLKKDVSTFINNPSYRYSFRKLNSVKKIEIESDAHLGKIIKIQFPYNQEYINAIEARRKKSAKIIWNKSQRAWNVPLTEENILYFVGFAKTNNFEIDDKLSNYFDQIKPVIDNIEEYAPMLCSNQGKIFYKNVNNNVPTIKAETLLEAILESRKRGILVWDKDISDYIENMNVDPFIKEFLKSDPSKQFHIDSATTSFDILSSIIKNLGPCLFVIPGGLELEKLNLAYGLLKNLGVPNESISVLFRLSNTIGKDFNEYIKQSKINNPISENTQAVFISTRVPKTIIRSNIKFHCAINLGFGGVHYSIKRFLENQENLINFADNSIQKEFNFGYM